jgi:hypothetical protein
MLRILLLACLLLLSNNQIIQDPTVDSTIIDPTIDSTTTDPALDSSFTSTNKLPFTKQITSGAYIKPIYPDYYYYQDPYKYTLKRSNTLVKSSTSEANESNKNQISSANPSSDSYTVGHKNVMLKPITIYVPVDNSDFEQKQTLSAKSNLRTSNP